MPAVDFSIISEGARVYLVPSLPIWGDQSAIRLGQTGLSFRGFRLIVRSPDNLSKRLIDRFILAEEMQDLDCPDFIQSQIDDQLTAIRSAKPCMDVAGLSMPLSFTKPLIMGVLNVTPDSFSDGGKFIDTDKAVTHARAMMAAGASLIDIGGESTRPGAKAVWEGEEADRVVPVITALAADGIPISIDTRHSFVMKAAIKAGGHIINDVTALTYDSESMDVVAACNAPVILMHSNGQSKDEPIYDDVLLDVYDYLKDRIKACVAAGIDHSRIMTDPGIGFGKRVVEDNLALLNGLSLFHTLGCPILLGASRKRFIGAIAGVEQADDRMAGSMASALHGITQGVQMVRVHDVAETMQAIKLQQAFHDHSLMDQPGLRTERLESLDV